MIIREENGGLLLFRQTDHALLSGAFAAAWGNDRLPAPARAGSVHVAAARHDDGWAEWELAPRIGTEGRPVDFIGIPVPEHVALYRHGIDIVEAEDLYAGLVVSMHGERLYTRPFVPGRDPRIAQLKGEDLELAEAYVHGEQRRQARLVDAVAAAERSSADAVRADAEEAWRLLQVWDRLSLLVCMYPPQSGGHNTMPPVMDADGEDVSIEVQGSGPAELRLDPYPFATAPVTFELEALAVPERSWEDEAAFRRAYRAASRCLLRVTCDAVEG